MPHVDEDCDGLADDADDLATGRVQTWFDGDSDGYGADDATPVLFCDPPASQATELGDCDDSDPSIHNGAVDVPNDNIDQDCDGSDVRNRILLEEDFEGDESAWVSLVGGSMFTTEWANSGVSSLRMDSGASAVSFDIAAADCLEITWEQYIKRGPEAPNGGEYLDFSYWDGTAWHTVLNLEGNDSDDAVFLRYAGTLPIGAANPYFAVGYARNYGAENLDEMFVKDITVTCWF